MPKFDENVAGDRQAIENIICRQRRFDLAVASNYETTFKAPCLLQMHSWTDQSIEKATSICSAAWIHTFPPAAMSSDRSVLFEFTIILHGNGWTDDNCSRIKHLNTALLNCWQDVVVGRKCPENEIPFLCLLQSPGASAERILRNAPIVLTYTTKAGQDTRLSS